MGGLLADGHHQAAALPFAAAAHVVHVKLVHFVSGLLCGNELLLNLWWRFSASEMCGATYWPLNGDRADSSVHAHKWCGNTEWQEHVIALNAQHSTGEELRTLR